MDKCILPIIHYISIVKDAYIQNMSDQDLLQKYIEEKNNYFLGILLERYTMLLLGVAMKYLKNEEDAKDAVQQIFLKVSLELQKYKVDYFKSWLYMVTRNYCLMQLRKRSNARWSILPDDIPIHENWSSINHFMEKEILLDQMHDAMEYLPEGQKTCIALFYLEKKSYQEITEMTGMTILQVKSNIQNGKRNLKNFIFRKMEIEKHG
ncbi:MAG: sigma-70 family RNA polymerase sigma factor [Bacteroidetes bacterium]|nr:sigma-70 family RNA polymerase sigma factor [Bacteroidota bacterium]